MFTNLTDKLQTTFKNIRGYGRLSEENIASITRDIRIALIEADVNYEVVKDFIASVKELALGEEVKNSLKPSEVFIKIISDELEKLLGSLVTLNSGNPKVIMMVGLQGSGKTTTTGKLALYLRKQKERVLMVACDIYRPAAIDQLKQIGKSLDIEVYTKDDKPSLIAKSALEYAKEFKFDTVLIDTAGRLQIDETLMDELKEIETLVKPSDTLLVLDAMIGQDSINVIKGFNDKITLTGSILTKLDGDARGGVALSLRKITNIPIKFIGNSESMDGLEFFDPKRMTSRILGNGDLMSIVEKVESIMDKDSAKEIIKGSFTLDDFLTQLRQIKRLGPVENVIKMLPGASKLKDVKVNPKDLLHTEAIILSMTKEERKNPDILKASRKIRIAKGAGVAVSDVNRLLKQYEQMKVMMKQIKNGNLKLPF